MSDSTAVSPGLVRLFGLTEEDGSISLVTVRERANRQLTRFADLALRQLAERQISMPPALSLVGNVGECLTLENEHPQAAEIQHWLQGNVMLYKHFKEAEVLFEVVRAAECIGETFPEDSCFHVGLTSAGPIGYFEVSHAH